MSSLIAITLGLCIGISPLGSSRIVKIIVLSVTGG